MNYCLDCTGRCHWLFLVSLANNIHAVIPKPLLCHVYCVLELLSEQLKGEPLALPEVLSILDQTFIKYIS